MRKSTIAILLTATLSLPALAVTPSPVEANGVVSELTGDIRSSWDYPPHNMYTFTKTEHILQSLHISKGDGPIAPLQQAEQQLDMNTLQVEDPALGTIISADELLERRIQSNGFLVLHKGKIVHESYRNQLDKDTRHMNFSTTKSIIGMLAQIAKQQGLLEDSDLASKYVPELVGNPAWKDVTVRDVLDMRDGTKFDENYDDDNSDVRIQDRAINWRPRLDNDPKGVRDFVSQNVDEKVAPTGTQFTYSSVQSEILGMIIEGATGQSLEQFFEDEFWSKIGAEHDAVFNTDGYGQPLAQGGLNLTLRDFARVAQLVMNKGKTQQGEQIIDASFFSDLVTPQKQLNDAFAHYKDFFGDSGQYRSQFWVVKPEAEQFMQVGTHGQIAYYDYQNDLAYVGFSSYPVAKDAVLMGSFFELFDKIKIELTK
ncbi:serine hydrolase [Agarivorans sp. 1_MG-2023]|uniref:serine hydrolase domain-containing protein n=1 Tax=Agarivorans sp. 1_MG-2023 TaxID=3062634 RepID=UPI0026E1449C|nr:serine hydrolase [Agarivorans sp. 1_MG-2023]MDO6766070.1 serine hydrolase [Agarivorans sp. 1_MG-2023]